MIKLLIGENSFEMSRAIELLVTTFDGLVEVIDGSEITLERVPDLFMGVSLFSTARLVVLKNISENKIVWPVLSEWLPRIAEDIQLVFVEPKPDKRTKSFKDLQKVADVHEYKTWSDRDVSQAEAWVVREAQKLGLQLDKSQARLVVQRAGLDQWALLHALEKLSVLDEVSEDTIVDVIAASPSENVFTVFQAALDGDLMKLHAMIANLAVTEDPYRLFGLLGGQVFQLAALSVADVPPGEVAKAIGAHPFALQKLVPYARKMRRTDIKKLVTAFHEADEAIKNGGEPWLLIERALLKTARI